MTRYKVTGIVYGNLWGGGCGAYPAETLESDNFVNLKEQIEVGIREGSLDSGMGYESLKGALMFIETIKTIIVKSKEYVNCSFKRVYFGDLTRSEKLFLSKCNF